MSAISARFTFPECPFELALTETSKKELEDAIHFVQEHPEMQFQANTISTRTLTGISKRYVIQVKQKDQPDTVLPIPVKVLLDKPSPDTPLEINVNFKAFIGRGSQRIVKLSFFSDGSTNIFYARKKVLRAYEKALLEQLKGKYYTGLASVHSLRRIKTAIKTKYVLGEELFQTTLDQALDKDFPRQIKTRAHLALDLMIGLSTLHTLKIEGMTIPLVPNSIPVFHGDLYARNVLFRFDMNKERMVAALNDFDHSGSVDSFCFPRPFDPPEFLKFFKDNFPKDNPQKMEDLQKIIDYHLKNGQAHDLWNLGIVLLEIITGLPPTMQGGFGVLPLPCLKECFKEAITLSELRWKAQLDVLTDERIVADLRSLRKDLEEKNPEESDQSLIRSVFVVIEDLLRVTPSERFIQKSYLCKLLGRELD